MILTYISEKPNSFQKGKDYLCFEVYIDLRLNEVAYRVVNSYGEIAIYDGNDFKVKQGNLVDMVFIENTSFNSYTIQLKAIQELDEHCSDVNGIWGAYHNGDKEIEEKIHAIVKKQAVKEGFPLEKVVAV